MTHRPLLAFSLVLVLAGCNATLVATADLTKNTKPGAKASAKPDAKASPKASNGLDVSQAPAAGAATWLLEDGDLRLTPRGPQGATFIFGGVPFMAGEVGDAKGNPSGRLQLSFGLEGGASFPWPQGPIALPVAIVLDAYTPRAGRNFLANSQLKGVVSGDAATSLRLIGTVEGDFGPSTGKAGPGDAFPFRMSVDIAFPAREASASTAPIASGTKPDSEPIVEETGFDWGRVALGIALDSAGNAWVTDAEKGAVVKHAPSGAVLATYPVGKTPVAVAIDAAGNAWVANADSEDVSKLSADGQTLGRYRVGKAPAGLAIDGAGNVWVANADSESVTKLSPAGESLGTYAVGADPVGVAVDPAGNVWLTSPRSAEVTKLSPAGELLGSYRVGTHLRAIHVDGGDKIWVAGGSNTVDLISPVGEVLNNFFVEDVVEAFAVDPQGHLWVVNGPHVTRLSPTGEVLKQHTEPEEPSGIVSTGEDRPMPGGITLDADGNAVVVYSNGTIARISK